MSDLFNSLARIISSARNLLSVFLICSVMTNPVLAQSGRIAYLLQEPGFPAVETAELLPGDIEAVIGQIPGLSLKVVTFEEFRRTRAATESSLLIWPYGSAVSDHAWQGILPFLGAGGNLLVTGGRPFSMEVFREGAGYTLKGWTNRFIEKLNIIDTEVVDAGDMVASATGHDFSHLDNLKISPPLSAYSILAMMSSRDLYRRDGSLSTYDGEWKSMFAGVAADGLRTVPLVARFDRLAERYTGGRWIFCTFEPASGYWQGTEGRNLLTALLRETAREPQDLQIRPAYACFRPDEKPVIDIEGKMPGGGAVTYRGELILGQEGRRIERFTFNASPGNWSQQFQVSKALKSGFYTLNLRLFEGREVVESRLGGFWVGEPGDMAGGAPFGVNSHFLTRGEESFPVAGMTYMASDVHRYYFIRPNAAVWDRDMAYMKRCGINMLRTGVWTGQEQIIDDNGVINEKSMRAFDAFFLTAKKYDLPVQFTFFAFQPSVPGSTAPYTDPAAIEFQLKLVQAFAARYRDNHDIIWDLINEPTYGLEGRTWDGNTPTGHPSEIELWDEWVRSRYNSDLERLAGNWNITLDELLDRDGRIRLPAKQHFALRNLYPEGVKPLPAFDYNLFSQYAYNRWAAAMRQGIRDAGSVGLVVSGQDEGGVRDRILNQFYAEESDFVSVHNWWAHDDLLWDNITGKPQGVPLLIQETGNMRYTDIRERARLSERELAASLERKMCFGLAAEGAGAIPWIWDLNVYMYNENEVFIGMHRGDGTAKEEVRVVRDIANFIAETAPFYSPAIDPEVLLVLPLSQQLSSYTEHAQRATAHAVRALHYYAEMPAIAASEYHLDRNSQLPKLIILPSARTVDEDAWKTLLDWVWRGAVMLVTGPVDRDAHFRTATRLEPFGLETSPLPIVQHLSGLDIDGVMYPLNYYGTMPMAHHERMAWREGSGSVRTIVHGKGKILVTEYPVEFNTNLETTAALYRHAAEIAGVSRDFSLQNPHPGILVRPMNYKDARLYLLLSETDRTHKVTLEDKTAGRSYTFSLEAGRARLLMISKKDGSVLGVYGLSDLEVK
jgi:hypothetical protein